MASPPAALPFSLSEEPGVRLLERRATGVAVGLLCVAALVPPLFARVLPLVDLPQHASQVALWAAHARDPEVARHYDVHLASPYVAFYVLWRACMLLGLSLDAAGRLSVALVVGAVPAAFAWLLHVRGRPPEWALFSFPVLYGHSLAFGFLPFFLTLPLFLASLALCSLWTLRGGWWRGALVTASGLVVLWSHGLTGALWLGACALLAVLDRGTLRARLLRLVPLVPVALAFGWMLRARGGGGMRLGADLLGRVRQIPLFLNGALTDEVHAAARWGTRLLLLVALLVPAAALVRERRWARGYDVPLLAAALLALALYLLLPFEIYGAYWIYCRFAPFAFLLAAASLAPVPWRAARLLLVVLLAGVSLATFVRVHRAFAFFSEQVGDARALFDRLPHGASVFRPEGTPTMLAPFQYPVLEHFATSAQGSTLGPAATFCGNGHMLVQENATPPARFDALLETAADGTLSVRARRDRLPDALVFYSPQPIAQGLRTEDGGGPYRLLGRTGGMHVFVRDTNRSANR